MLKEIIESYPEESFLSADGFDSAILGVDETSMCLVYSISECVSILMSQGLSREEAKEYFSFNVSGSYVGDKTPIWCQDDFD